MVLVAALADVVQKERDIKYPAVHPLLQDRRGDGQFLDQFAALDLVELADALDDVLVHRVAVIHVELHQGADRLELGDEGRQHAQFVHAAQRAFGVAVFHQQVEKQLLCLRVVAQAVVDEVDVGGHQAHRVGVDQEPGAQPLLEQPQEVQPVGQELAGIDDGQTAMHLPVAGFQPPLAFEEPLQERLRLHMRGLELGQKDAGEFAHGGGVAEIVLHEMLDRAAAGGVGIAHAPCDLDLQIECQLFAGAAGGQMQVAAHRPQEIVRLGKGGEFLFGKEPRRHQLGHVVDMVDVFCHPKEAL